MELYSFSCINLRQYFMKQSLANVEASDKMFCRNGRWEASKVAV